MLIKSKWGKSSTGTVLGVLVLGTALLVACSGSDELSSVSPPSGESEIRVSRIADQADRLPSVLREKQASGSNDSVFVQHDISSNDAQKVGQGDEQDDITTDIINSIIYMFSNN